MANGADDQRQTMYEMAEAIARTWERRREFVEAVAAPVRAWMLDQLDAQPGQTLLEVAAGVGETGFEAAAAVGDRGRLISTDFAPTMVDAARRRGSELGLTNVEYRVADASETGLDDDSVDGVLCRFGYMLMVDPAAALAEARRVVRPGGRIALGVWGAPERNPFFTTIGMSLVQRGVLPPPDPTGPGIFAMANPERTRSLVEGAGFEGVRTEEVDVVFRVRDAEDYVEVTADTAGPVGLALQALPDADRKELTEQLRGAMARFETGAGYEIPGMALCAAGTSPA